MKKYEKWLLQEKYGREKSAPVFNESKDEIKNKYPWGEAFFADCERLAGGEPLDYVIGFVPFLDAKIWLDSQPLIPRPETEFWVEQAIAAIKVRQTNRTEESAGAALGSASRKTFPERLSGELDSCRGQRRAGRSSPKILDLCAGSGAIGVAVAKAVPEARVDFGEIDTHLLPTIEKNCTKNLSVNCKVGAVIQSDLFSNINDRYDFILSNPPYIDPALDRTQASVKTYEPHLALYGGTAGLELIEKIITEVPRHLTPEGHLWLEHEPEQVADVTALAHAHAFSIETHTDQYQLPRYSILTMK